MDDRDLISRRVQEYFVLGDNNCAMTVLRVLSEALETPLPPATLSAGWMMPGAGGVGDLCGLVSGALMFIGVWGAAHGYHRSELKPVSMSLVEGIQAHFGSIHCRDLRSEADGCATLAVEFLTFTLDYLAQALKDF